MAREDFYDSLRLADRLRPPMKVVRPGGKVTSFQGDAWLTPTSVDAFNPADFADWPREEREKLQAEVEAFLAVAQEVSPNAPVPEPQRRRASKHLEAAIKLVRDRLLREWLGALDEMLAEAEAAARAKGWYVQKDKMKVKESLLREYSAPSLLIRTWDRELRLMPVARFCAGRQGAVDVMVSPDYERAYSVSFKDGRWHLVPLQGRRVRKPFNRETFARTIARLSQFHPDDARQML